MNTLQEKIQRRTMTVHEVADYLGVHHSTIYKLVRKKEIPHIRVGSRILFYEEAITNWMLNQDTMKPHEKVSLY